jgi:drug/metabolite transporter (DMT)-like permease
MNAVAAILLLFLAIFFDQLFILNLPFSLLEWSVIGLGLITSIAYTLYVYTVKVSGPVFASQVGYIVTSSGVMWGILIFDEVNSAWVWGSLFIMLIGLSLVLPKK